MVEHKLVMSTKDGKSYQKEIKSPEADHFHGKHIGNKISGDQIGFSGYEFELTGGSDKCGFPMRKGVQQHRKKVRIEGGVGFSGKNRTKGKQKGLLKRRTVCGERVTSIIRQINLKVIKEGSQPLGEAPTAEAAEKPAEGAAQEAPKGEVKDEKKEEEKAAETPKEEPNKEKTEQ